MTPTRSLLFCQGKPTHLFCFLARIAIITDLEAGRVWLESSTCSDRLGGSGHHHHMYGYQLALVWNEP